MTGVEGAAAIQQGGPQVPLQIAVECQLLKGLNSHSRPNCDIHDVGLGAQERSPIHLASVGPGLLKPSGLYAARRLLRRYLSSIDTRTKRSDERTVTADVFEILEKVVVVGASCLLRLR